MKKPMVDYGQFRLNKINDPQFSHLKLLLGWVAYLVLFFLTENLVPAERCYPVHCWLDDLIPFCEWFVIPYYYWFVFLIGFGAFWFFFEVEAFREWMWAIILSYTVTVVIYIAWPNMQELRPVAFERDNFMVDIVKGLYDFDTNTNVCPSIHCLGSFATTFAGLHSKKLRGVWWKLSFVLTSILISASTVFLKQHSIIDVFVAIGVAAVCYAVQYWIFPKYMTAPKENQVPKGAGIA